MHRDRTPHSLSAPLPGARGCPRGSPPRNTIRQSAGLYARHTVRAAVQSSFAGGLGGSMPPPSGVWGWNPQRRPGAMTPGRRREAPRNNPHRASEASVSHLTARANLPIGRCAAPVTTRPQGARPGSQRPGQPGGPLEANAPCLSRAPNPETTYIEGFGARLRHYILDGVSHLLTRGRAKALKRINSLYNQQGRSMCVLHL